jgi:hypothetical protein
VLREGKSLEKHALGSSRLRQVLQIALWA